MGPKMRWLEGVLRTSHLQGPLNLKHLARVPDFPAGNLPQAMACETRTPGTNNSSVFCLAVVRRRRCCGCSCVMICHRRHRPTFGAVILIHILHRSVSSARTARRDTAAKSNLIQNTRHIPVRLAPATNVCRRGLVNTGVERILGPSPTRCGIVQ